MLINKEGIKTKKDKVLYALKTLELELLKEFDRVCRKNDIKYHISGGTLLGAVRHKGFIPWDDDIDIEISHSEFDRFSEAFKRDGDHSKFELISFEEDKKRFQTFSIIGLKGTNMLTRLEKKGNAEYPLSIDIFLLDYLPNDLEKRKKIASRIYWSRILLYYKALQYRFDIPEKYQRPLNVLNKFIPFSFYRRLYTYYITRQKTPSDWVLDNVVFRGITLGYPASFREEFIDMEFEDTVVMGIKGYDGYLKNHYGNYMELPPIDQRVTNHKWATFDLGKYEKDFDLPENYAEYMIISVNEDRAETVKQLCFDMIKEVDRICKKHDIKYYIGGNDAKYKASDLDDYGKLWRTNVIIMMDRDNLEKFRKVAVDDNELDKKYFYQDSKTDKEYKIYHPKIRLNGTEFRDVITYPAEIHNGVWIDIDVLVNAPNDHDERVKFAEEIKDISLKQRLRWLFTGVRIDRMKPVNRKRRKTVAHLSVEEVTKLRDSIIEKYQNEDTDYYMAASAFPVNTGVDMKKEYFAEGKELEYLGNKFVFPANLEKWCESVLLTDTSQDTAIKNLKKRKSEDLEKYKKAAVTLTEKAREAIDKKIGYFTLNSYDHPDYRVTMPEEIESENDKKS